MMKFPKFKNRVLNLALITAVWLFSTLVSSHAIEIQEVESSKGIKALLVEDYTLPIIAVSFSFDGGSAQDVDGKEGTVSLLRSLMDEGAGDFDSTGFQARLEELGVEMGFSSSSERFRGGFRTLASERVEAFKMLRLALNEPRFDEDAISRMRDAIRTSLIRSETNPSAQGSKARREAMFAEHPYVKPGSGDLTTIEAITRDDIVAMHRNILAREDLVIGVVGAISANELSALLDDTFGGLPEKNDIVQVPEVEPALGDDLSIEMPVPNVSIALVLKGIKRDDPKFFAAFLMNHVLGGGTFTSRLYDEVREKRGLAYGVSSSLVTTKNTSYLIAGTSTRQENRDEALAVIKSVIDDVRENGITQKELDDAKRYVIGSYAINNLDTSSKIANVLVGLQVQELGLDYIDARVAQIEKVTLEDVNAMARDLLSVKPTTVLVGPANQ